MKDLNLDFIRLAERVTTFNLSAADFNDLNHKKEIQHLFNKHFFPKFDMAKTIKGVDQRKLNSIIAELKREDRKMLEQLHKYTLRGFGPGEILLFFLIDDAYLGGGSSAGVDLISKSSGPYEIKSVDVTNKTYATNFKTGATFKTSDLIKRAQDLKKEVGDGGGSEVNLGTIDKIKDKFPDAWNQLEKDYQQRVYDNYFKHHDIIFMQNSTQKIGEILSIKRVKKEEILFERVTSGTIKPRIKL